MPALKEALTGITAGDILDAAVGTLLPWIPGKPR